MKTKISKWIFVPFSISSGSMGSIRYSSRDIASNLKSSEDESRVRLIDVLFSSIVGTSENSRVRVFLDETRELA